MDSFTDNRTQPTRFVGHGNIKFTREGGLAIRMLNKTGITSEKGRLVAASTGTENAVELCGADDTDVIGVMYDTGREVDELMWVVIAGIAQVLLKDDTSSTRGYWVGASDDASYAYATESSPPAQPEHFQEIGHCVHTVTATGAGTHVLCNIMMHFN